MLQWDVWVVHQQHARKELKPTQPNDPSDYNRMYAIVANPSGGPTAICCPIQNSLGAVGLTEVALQRNYATYVKKDCKIVCHEVFTLPMRFFEKKVGFLRPPEQDQIQTALIAVFDL
jgi:mRNA-degrading endonuclease toxin of MazEF toxin-antitoxin module